MNLSKIKDINKIKLKDAVLGALQLIFALGLCFVVAALAMRIINGLDATTAVILFVSLYFSILVISFYAQGEKDKKEERERKWHEPF